MSELTKTCLTYMILITQKDSSLLIQCSEN